MNTLEEVPIQYTENQIGTAIRDLNNVIAPGLVPSDPLFVNAVNNLLNTTNDNISKAFINAVFSKFAGMTNYQMIVDLLNDPPNAMIADITNEVNQSIGDRP